MLINKHVCPSYRGTMTVGGLHQDRVSIPLYLHKAKSTEIWMCWQSSYDCCCNMTSILSCKYWYIIHVCVSVCVCVRVCVRERGWVCVYDTVRFNALFTSTTGVGSVSWFRFATEWITESLPHTGQCIPMSIFLFKCLATQNIWIHFRQN